MEPENKKAIINTILFISLGLVVFIIIANFLNVPVMIQGPFDTIEFCKSEGFEEAKGFGLYDQPRCCKINNEGFKECESINCRYNYNKEKWICDFTG